VRPISVRARCSESHSRFGTLNKMGEAYQRIMLVGSPRTRSARRRRGLSLASCHCGAVTFNVDAELQTKAVSCNCSSCRQKGLLLSFFSADKFTLTSGENALTTYEFYAHKIAHRFCIVCGSQSVLSGKTWVGSAMCALTCAAFLPSTWGP
jgi:hypothetical protein